MRTCRRGHGPILFFPEDHNGLCPLCVAREELARVQRRLTGSREEDLAHRIEKRKDQPRRRA